MQMDQVKRIREKHKDAGSPEHEHQWEKEYYLGSQTGDEVCTQCGESLPRR